jgi:hypothetical protein
MEAEVAVALCGDNVRVRLRGVDDEDISPGFVLTSVYKPIHAVRQFEAQLAILEHKNIICAGYSAVMHIHTASEEVSLTVSYPCSLYSFVTMLTATAVRPLLRLYCITLIRKLVESQRNHLSLPRKVKRSSLW